MCQDSPEWRQGICGPSPFVQRRKRWGRHRADNVVRYNRPIRAQPIDQKREVSWSCGSAVVI
jgi:hypothetical protein